MLLQFPLYWFSVPAVMKGWMDRVLTQGFAFSLEKMYNNGVFKVRLSRKTSAGSDSDGRRFSLWIWTHFILVSE